MSQRTETLKKRCRQDMIGNSEPLVALYSQMRQVAPTDATVLILGETGAGKDFLAKAIHELSPRRAGPFVAIDCGGLSETLLESELFGHRKGAYTGAVTDEAGLFEEADGGTVFIDEIATASMAVQSKLLRFLEEGEIRRVGENEWRKVDVRVICATNRDLEEEVNRGCFRRDLFFRLKVVLLRIPPLRDRGRDILLLAEHFRKVYSSKSGKPVRGFAKEAVKAMLKAPWEGNVRELQHAVERGVILCKGKSLGLADLELPVQPARGKSGYREVIESQRQRLVERALSESDGNVSRAAASLRMERMQFYRLMKRFGVQGKMGRWRPKKKVKL